MTDLHFLDPDIIDESSGVVLRVNPPKREEIEFPERKPWETMRGLYLTIREDVEKIRMWYGCRSRKGNNGKSTAYAESDDGIEWRCPELTRKGSDRPDNLTDLQSMAGSPDVLPEPSDGYRFFGTWNIFGKGLYVFRSKDGLQWQQDPEPILGFEFDTQNVCFYDPNFEKYVGYVRAWTDGLPTVRRRHVARWEADSIDKPLGIDPLSSVIGQERLAHVTEELPIVMTADDADGPDTDVYTSAVIRHPVQEGFYLAFPVFYTHFPESDDQPYENAGTCETHFMGSSDGKSWHRYDRTVYGPRLPDEGMLYFGRGMIQRGDELWQYGVAYRSHHGDVDFRLGHGDGTIVRFIQRKDGFVSADATDGVFATKPMKLLRLPTRANAIVESHGSIQVRIRDVKGSILAESGPIRGNAVSIPLRWPRVNTPQPLSSAEVSIECRIQNGKLFGLNFDADG